MTDEQRKRFEGWEQTEAAAFLDDPDHCNYSLAEAVWLHAWLARDAEVQALKAALTTAQDALLKVGHRLAKVHEDADGAEIALDAHYATQKAEGKAADAD